MKPQRNRGLKNRVAFSNSIKKELSEEFEKLVAETGYNKSKLLDGSVYLLLELYKKEGLQGIRDILRRIEQQKDPE